MHGTKRGQGGDDMHTDEELDSLDELLAEDGAAQIHSGAAPRGVSAERDLPKVARNSVLLSALPRDLACNLLAQGMDRSYARGETIFLQNEPARRFFLVLEGCVKVYRMTESGAEAVIAVFTEGQSFGETVACRGMPYPVSCEAVSDCRLLQIEADLLLRAIDSDRDALAALLTASCQIMQALVRQIEDLKARTGAQRVARFLLDQAGVEAGAVEFNLPHDKVLLAGRLGMKPESLSRAFSRLKREAGVEVKGHFVRVSDIEGLQQFSIRDPALAWSKPG
ncbi:Crp/Fnr family transcriptional regulator [Amaricoccus macauensis]|uniref:Crp/Fnr family transcriptional regulator n=1 Tax=Amaricoccus macauensis TaxID=57001 RepID=UPI003C7C32FE